MYRKSNFKRSGFENEWYSWQSKLKVKEKFLVKAKTWEGTQSTTSCKSKKIPAHIPSLPFPNILLLVHGHRQPKQWARVHNQHQFARHHIRTMFVKIGTHFQLLSCCISIPILKEKSYSSKQKTENNQLERFNKTFITMNGTSTGYFYGNCLLFSSIPSK